MREKVVKPVPATLKLKLPTFRIIKAGDPKGRSGVKTFGNVTVLRALSVDIAQILYRLSMVKLPVILTLVAPPKYSAAVSILEVVKCYPFVYTSILINTEYRAVSGSAHSSVG